MARCRSRPRFGCTAAPGDGSSAPFDSREDVLRKVNRGWKVARRTIVLDADVLLNKNLGVFLLETISAEDAPLVRPLRLIGAGSSI